MTSFLYLGHIQCADAFIKVQPLVNGRGSNGLFDTNHNFIVKLKFVFQESKGNPVASQIFDFIYLVHVADNALDSECVVAISSFAKETLNVHGIVEVTMVHNDILVIEKDEHCIPVYIVVNNGPQCRVLLAKLRHEIGFTVIQENRTQNRLNTWKNRGHPIAMDDPGDFISHIFGESGVKLAEVHFWRDSRYISKGVRVDHYLFSSLFQKNIRAPPHINATNYCWGFIINGRFKVQEKVVGFKKGGVFFVSIHTNAGKTERKRNYKSYSKGDNDFYWIWLDGSLDTFYIFPESAFLANGIVDDPKDRKHLLCLSDRTWTAEFKYTFNDKERIMELFQQK